MTITRLTTAAERYLGAYLDLASSEKDISVSTDMATLAELCAIPEFANIIKNPLIKAEAQLTLLQKLFPLLSLHKITQNFLCVLARNGRFAELPSLTRAFPRFYAERQGRPLVDVTTPSALSEAEKQKLTTTLKDTYKKDIYISFDTDPTLLGGMLVQIGSEMLDTTLKSKLNRMQSQLKGTG